MKKVVMFFLVSCGALGCHTYSHVRTSPFSGDAVVRRMSTPLGSSTTIVEDQQGAWNDCRVDNAEYGRAGSRAVCTYQMGAYGMTGVGATGIGMPFMPQPIFVYNGGPPIGPTGVMGPGMSAPQRSNYVTREELGQAVRELDRHNTRLNASGN